MTLHELENQIAALSLAEKAALIQRLTAEIADNCPGIERTLGVAGGEACIAHSRIPIWTLENYRRLGWTEAQLLQNFPSLQAIDLVDAWMYAAAHQEEIDLAITKNEAA